MLNLKSVYCVLIVIAEFFGIYFLTKEFIQIKKRLKVLFFVMFLVYEIYNIAGNILAFGQDGIKLMCLLIPGIIFCIGSAEKKLWNIVYFYCNVLLLRSFCQFIKFIFLTFYSGAKMEVVLSSLQDFSVTLALFYLLFYIPGYVLSGYLWKQLTMCASNLFRIVCLVLVILLFTMEMFHEWVQILITMPTVILLLALITVFRIESERVESHRLEYYKDLEEQMREMDRELEEIRSEVEKYFKRAGENHHNYAEQILEKIEQVKGDKV